MIVKIFEDLEIWKDARRLTQRIYQLTRMKISQKILLCEIKSDGPRCRSCRT